MLRYFLYLSYNGTTFHGWQRQENAGSVQETIEDSLSKICRSKVFITGAGRTDTGVHAKEMVAHVDLSEELQIDDHFIYKLNNVVGPEIAIHAIVPVHENAHARFDATGRTYQYRLLKKKDPFHKELGYHHYKALDFEKMNEAAAFLVGKKDFSSFSRSNTQTKTNLCNLEFAAWKETEEEWIFEIKADRFLRNMVRAIVGTLLEIGEGKREASTMKEVISKKDRSEAGTSAPARGLFLVKIDYPKSVFK